MTPQEKGFEGGEGRGGGGGGQGDWRWGRGGRVRGEIIGEVGSGGGWEGYPGFSVPFFTA